MRTTQTLEYSEAARIINAVIAKARGDGQPVVVAVADPHGELIALARMDGVAVTSVRVAANKAYTAARARKPTKAIGDKSRHPEQGFDIAYYGDRRFVGWGGGVPVWKDGELVGAVAVSGLTADEDAALATLGIEAFQQAL
jgi:glc operon protein GlcG